MLVAVIVGGNLFSVVGILVSVPLCSVLYTLFKEAIDDRLDKKKAAEVVATTEADVHNVEAADNGELKTLAENKEDTEDSAEV